MHDDSSHHSHDSIVQALRDSIVRAFPADVYTGQVTPWDGSFTAELDDEELLFKALKGRRWTEVEPSFLSSQPDGYLLLTEEAYRAFLPAWLLWSLQDLEAENEVRDFVISSFATTARQLRALDSAQRSVVRSLLAYFAQHYENSFMRQQATEAVENVERAERNLSS